MIILLDNHEKILLNFETRKKLNKQENLNNFFLLTNFNQQLRRTIFFLLSVKNNWRTACTLFKAHFEVWDNFWQLKPFKNDENAFYFTLKALSFS